MMSDVEGGSIGDFGIYCRCDVADSFSRMNLFILLSLSQWYTLVQGGLLKLGSTFILKGCN